MPKYLEWQSIETKKLIVTNSENIQELEIECDNDFNLNVKLFCQYPKSISYPSNPETIYSEVFKNIDEIEAVDRINPIEKYRLVGFNITSSSTNANDSLTYSGVVRKIYKIFDSSAMGDRQFVIYWLLNSSNDLSYTEGSEITKKEEEEYSWGGFATDKFNFHPERSFARNLIQLKYKNNDFLLGKVDKKHHRKASFIRFKDNEFISQEDFSELLHLLSYFLGVEFLHIGTTYFNKASSPIEQSYISTFHSGIDNILDQYDLPPIPIRLSDHYSLQLDSKEQINNGIQAYLNNKEHFSLERILWYINYARHQHPLVKMQPVSTAFDMICTMYYKNADNNYIDKKMFSLLKKEFYKILTDIIPERNIIDEFKQRIGNLNNNSINKRNKNIFNDLNMQLSALEQDSLNSRNASIHGTIGDIDYIKLIKESNAYFTLVNRLILRILNLQYYIDYSVQGKYINDVRVAQKGEYKVYKN
jgi:hypothetical protein